MLFARTPMRPRAALIADTPQNYRRVVRQCCSIRTELDPTTVRHCIEQTIGSRSNTLIVPLRYGYSMRIKDPATRKRCRAHLDAACRRRAREHRANLPFGL